MNITEEQKQEIMNFGKVRVSYTLYSWGVDWKGYINDKQITGMYDRFYQALQFVEQAQYKIRNNQDVDIDYYYEYENARDWLKEEGVEL